MVLVLGGLFTLHTTAAVLVPQPLLDPTVSTNYGNTTSATFIVMGSHTYFLTGDTSTGNNIKLWKTDGGSGNSTLVKDIGVVGSVTNIITNGTLLYFSVGYGSTFIDLWQSDGTPAGTTKVSGVGGQINVGVPNTNIASMVVVGTDLYFSASVGGALNASDFQLYKYTGSGSATQYTSFNNNGNTFSQVLVNVNGAILFTSGSTTLGYQDVFRIDPAVSSARSQITSFGAPSGANATLNGTNVFGTTLYFLAADTSQLHSGNPERHWWRVESDGTGLTNLTPNGFTASGTPTFRKVGSNYYFVMTDSVSGGANGNQLFKMDGVTTKGATLYSNQDGSHNGGFISNYEVLGTQLVFPGVFAGTTGTEPAVINTTDSTGSAALLKDINPGSGNSSPANFQPLGSTLYFSANITTTPGNVSKLFKTDGTSGGTVQVADINAVGSTDAIGGTKILGNTLYFRAQNASSPSANERLPYSLVNVSLAAGSGQTVAVNSAAATALQVNVKDTANIGNVSGVAVTFAPPGSGASGSFSSSATVITDANGNATAPTFTANGTTGAYSVKVLLSGVDTSLAFSLTNSAVTTPTVASISSTTTNGSYNATVLIPITVTFSAPVTVTGTPTLALNSGGSATYASGSGTSTLTFNYTVGASDNATDLDCSSTTALALAGGTINATTGGTAANLTLPTPGGANSLGVNKAIVIDTTPPTITSIVRLTPTGQTTTSNSVTFRVTYSESVTGPGTSNFAVVAVNGSNIVGTVTSVTGSGNTRDVAVTINSGTGEFRLRGVN